MDLTIKYEHVRLDHVPIAGARGQRAPKGVRGAQERESLGQRILVHVAMVGTGWPQGRMTRGRRLQHRCNASLTFYP
jgi:hypothetical protein